MEAPAEIKVKTRKFSLTKGTIKISFELEGSRGRIRSLKLKQRNAVLDTSFPFEMQTAKKGNTIVYHAQINVDQYPMETAFWDVVASVDKEGKGNYEDAILGGLSSSFFQDGPEPGMGIWFIPLSTEQGSLPFNTGNMIRNMTAMHL